MTLGEVLAAVAYVGAGAGVGSIGAAVVTSRSGRGEARAHAADLITNAAGRLAVRQQEMIESFEEENRHLRRSVTLLADAFDEVIPMLTGPPEAIAQIRKAVTAARLAI